MKEKAGLMTVLGTMSGTSMDGIDAAVLVTDGQRIAGFGPTGYRAYTPDERETLRAGLHHWPGDAKSRAASKTVTAAHCGLLKRFSGVDLIGFHGQTLAHDPGGRGTHQAGDGAALATELGVPVVWDMRGADVKAGGQGAPLAPAYHFALARYIGAEDPIAFLNLGGVGNLTWVDPRAADPFEPGAMLAFDTGPANAPLDDLMRERLGRACDRDGALAARGKIRKGTLDSYLAHPFFDTSPPKSLDRDDFAGLGSAVAALVDEDAAATLVEACVLAVAKAIAWCRAPPVRLLVTGGGRLNPVMMARLSHHLSFQVEPVEEAGLDGDMIEAQAFGYLAVRSLHGLPLTGPGTTGVAKPLTGGRLSRPGPDLRAVG